MNMRSLSVAACATVLGLICIATPLEAAHTPNVHAKRRANDAVTLKRRPNKYVACSGSDPSAFLGVTDSNHAAAADSAVLGGDDNDACAVESAIGGGLYNGVGAIRSFIAGGSLNNVYAQDGFIGSGVANATTAAGAFVGAGGEAYYGTSPMGVDPQPGNLASGMDSFVGAGDLNQVSGNGSFIGAGGLSDAQAGTQSASNEVSGVDSFLGAGDQNSVNGSWSFIGGGELNAVNGSGSFIGGGGYLSSTTTALGNTIGGSDSFIGAGDSNTIATNDAFIGGGTSNQIQNSKPGVGGRYALIAGGLGNTISASADNGAEYGVIAGGIHNSLTGIAAVIGGGYASAATGSFATIPGGERNLASGAGSFAAGTNAQAIQAGTFAWSDGAGSLALKTSKPYQFAARASGGFVLYSNAGETSGVQLNAGSGAWASLSDRAAKTGVVALDDAAVLERVAALPVSEWSYSSEHGVRHVGPMAQDFYAAFRVGADDRHITSIDEDGIALAAIKALHAENRDLRVQVRLDHARLVATSVRENGVSLAAMKALHSENRDLRAQVALDHARLAALERKVEALASR